MKTDSPATRLQRERMVSTLSSLGLKMPEWFIEAMIIHELHEFTVNSKLSLDRWLRATDNLSCIFEGCSVQFNPHRVGRTEGDEILTGWASVANHDHRLRNEGGIYYSDGSRAIDDEYDCRLGPPTDEDSPDYLPEDVL